MDAGSLDGDVPGFAHTPVGVAAVTPTQTLDMQSAATWQPEPAPQGGHATGGLPLKPPQSLPVSRPFCYHDIHTRTWKQGHRWTHEIRKRILQEGMPPLRPTQLAQATTVSGNRWRVARDQATRVQIRVVPSRRRDTCHLTDTALPIAEQRHHNNRALEMQAMSVAGPPSRVQTACKLRSRAHLRHRNSGWTSVVPPARLRATRPAA